MPTTNERRGWKDSTKAGRTEFIPLRPLFTSIAVTSPPLTMTKSTSLSFSSFAREGSRH
ncbi:MAG: hypothetical protein IKH89_08235 [Bacteroidales bacterium]|nr:hypothetical protein [Bacteroidales bacterium]